MNRPLTGARRIHLLSPGAPATRNGIVIDPTKGKKTAASSGTFALAL